MKQFRRPGVLAQKLGMSALFLKDGQRVPVTLFKISHCAIVSHVVQEGQVVGLQIGAGQPKHVTKPLKGHFAKCGVSPKKKLKEFRVSEDAALPVGTVLQSDYFVPNDFVDVSGRTIGRGFAGAMKRHNFRGLRATHGVSVSHRSHGSTGHRKDPAKVFKNKKMAGHMGCVNVTVLNLKVMFVDAEKGLLGVKGSVPGFEGGWVTVRDAIKKPLTQGQKEVVARLLAAEVTSANE